VGSTIALHIKELFYVSDAARVFYNKSIKQVGVNVNSLKMDAEHAFKDAETQIFNHLGWLITKDKGKELGYLFTLAEQFSLLKRLQHEERTLLMDLGFIIDELKTKFEIINPKVSHRHANDPLKPLHQRGIRTWFFEFSRDQKDFLFNYNSGQLWIYFGKNKEQVIIYNLLYDPFG
jgi:hypothetical protein